MNKFKKVSIVALLFLIIGLVGASLTSKQATAQMPLEEIEITDSNFQQIEILTYDAKVEVHSTNRNNAYIEVSGKKVDKRLSLSVQDSLLFIKYNNKEFKLFNFNLFAKEESLKVYVPERDYDQIKVTMHDGLLSIEKVNTDQLIVKGRDGKISLKDITANTTQIQGNDGILDIYNVLGAVNANMKDSIIKMQLNEIEAPINLEARDGMIQLAVTEEPQNTFINTSIKDGFVTIFGERMSSMLYGTGDNKVTLKLGDGKITVK